MHSNEQLIQKFYACFQARDAAGMSACYAPNVVFSDPVFGRLEAAQAAAMWQMLAGRAKDLAVTVSNIHADDRTGGAHWEARYSFGKSGRLVHNIVEAAFVFQDGRIVQHTDTFDLWRWSGMALGPVGSLLGWTPFIQSSIRKDARRQLENFIQKQRAA